jgi:hypothetical protein
MADIKISQLPAATTPLAGTEEVPLTQSGTTKKVSVTDLRGGVVVTEVTGTAPVVSSGGATPAISMPAATTSTNGYLTSADWNTFNGKQPAGSYLTSGGALGTPSSGTATNLTGLPLTTGVTGLLPVASGGTGTATPSLVAGTNVSITGTWPNQTVNATGGGGSGTVTSVAATVPSFLSVTGSPITTAGTLAISYSGTALPVANGGTGSTTSTGSGSVVLATSPTLVTPLLGTPTSGNFSTGTFTWPTFNQNTTGTATNITATSNSTLTTLSALSLPGSQVSGNISGNAANVTGTVAVANGGSGTTTAQGAINAFAGAVTSGSYLRGNGTNVVMNTIQAADVPTLNQNTTGTAANVTGTVAVANGGTGATSLTANNVILGNGTSAVQVVAPGTTGNLLTSNGTTWVSSAPAAPTSSTSIGLVRAVAINCILP